MLLLSVIRSKKYQENNYFSTVIVNKPEEYESCIDRDLDCLRAVNIPVISYKVKIYLNEKGLKMHCQIHKKIKAP